MMSLTVKDLIQFGGLISTVVAAVWYLSRRLAEIENKLTKFIERLSAQDSRITKLEARLDAHVAKTEAELKDLSKEIQATKERQLTHEAEAR